MITRTTIALNHDYLQTLKLLAIKQQKSLSGMVNEAVRAYLSRVKMKPENYLFFQSLGELKDDLDLNKKELFTYIRKGRL